MKALAAILTLPLATSCTIHLHVHESPRPAVERADPAPGPAPHVPDGVSISGRVVDRNGAPEKAHVACVSSNGSVSSTTDDSGGFSLGVREPHVTVTVTSDEKIGIHPDVPCGTESLVVMADEIGATLWVELDGRPSARLALFDGDVRFRDFTLREGKRARTVVPARRVTLMLYGEDLEVRREIELEPRASTEVRFELDG